MGLLIVPTRDGMFYKDKIVVVAGGEILLYQMLFFKSNC